MSISKIPERVKIQLWMASGGRCAYCNKALWRDDLKMFKMNRAYIAHIVADTHGGPRGDKVRSPLLAKEFSNLMLMCDEHHRLIDREDVSGHPEESLLQMKRKHESRIELVTSIQPQNKTHLVFFGANIGQQNAPVTVENACQAILPYRYPVSERAIELSLKNSLTMDHEDNYWIIETENLQRNFDKKIEPIITGDSVKSFSLFAIAPQPLLIKLGALFSDISELEVFQKHREPSTWNWQDKSTFNGFKVIPPKKKDGIPALNLSLSATITNERINEVFDEDVSIWTITHDNPGNDFLKSKEILKEFRMICRELLNEIKAEHGQSAILHLFPAMPVSAAVEFGRIWMPKADLTLKIFDQNKIRNGFYETISLT